MSAREKAALRLAVRTEGGVIRCYLAQLQTMDDAIQVMALQEEFAHLPGVRDEFLKFAQLLLIRACDVAGLSVSRVETHDAPEHERAGHA